jgi:hypothetical protein
VTSQKKSLAQTLGHGDFTHTPWAQTWETPHETPAQPGTQAPA